MVELIKYAIMIGAILVVASSRRWALPTLAFFVPLMQWLPEIPITGVNAMNLMLLPVLIRAVAAGKAEGPNRRGDPLAWPLTIFALLFLVSYVRTLIADDLPWWFSAQQGPFLLKIVKEVMSDMLMYFCARRLARSYDDMRRAFGGVMAGFLFESLTACREFLFSGTYRTTAHLGQPNKMGNFLAGYMMMPFGFALTYRGKIFLASGAVVAASLLGLLGALSRGSLLAAGAGMLIVAIVRRSGWLIVIVVLAATATLWLPENIMDRFENTVVSEEVDGTDEGEREGRLELWEPGLRMIASNPMGVGLEQFRFHLREYGYDGFRLKTSHNIYIQLAAEQGILAALLHIWVMLRVALMGLELARGPRGTFNSGFGLGMLGIVLAFTISTMFGDGFYENNLSGLFWILAGLTTNLRDGWGVDEGTPEEEAKR